MSDKTFGIMKKTKEFRLPRPLGMTQAMAAYRKDPTPEFLDKIHSLFIQYWITNSGMLCGRIMSAVELADFLKTDPERIRMQMRDSLLSTKLWDRDKQEELINSMIGQQITWALEDRMAIEGQAKILQRSQGQKYVPFVTAEVNKVLGLKMQSTANLQGILRSLQGGGSINIFNQNSNTQENVGITLDKAIEVIIEENKKLDKPVTNAKFIEEHYDTSEFPVVVATQQQGVDTSKEMISISQEDMDQISGDYKGILGSFEDEHHEIRREIELNIDRDAEDPESLIYPA